MAQYDPDPLQYPGSSQHATEVNAKWSTFLETVALRNSTKIVTDTI